MNTLRLIGVASLLLVLLSVACGPEGEQASEKSVLTAGEPGRSDYPAGEPGETTVLDRAYDIAPPLVPHTVDELEITRSTNDCIDCHFDGDEVDEGHVATKIPESHFVNDYTGQKSKDGVTGTRYQCLQCHVPQSDAVFPPSKI